jgi:hypothetical protein
MRVVLLSLPVVLAAGLLGTTLGWPGNTTWTFAFLAGLAVHFSGEIRDTLAGRIRGRR